MYARLKTVPRNPILLILFAFFSGPIKDQAHRGAHMRSKSHVPSVARPHSADFLEFEARHMDTSHAAGVGAAPVRAPRPKSSLDINRAPDTMYYSEASYAEKMRQSALYLQKSPSVNNASSMLQGL